MHKATSVSEGSKMGCVICDAHLVSHRRCGGGCSCCSQWALKFYCVAEVESTWNCVFSTANPCTLPHSDPAASSLVVAFEKHRLIAERWVKAWQEWAAGKNDSFLCPWCEWITCSLCHESLYHTKIYKWTYPTFIPILSLYPFILPYYVLFFIVL